MRTFTVSLAFATALAGTACYSMRPVTIDELGLRRSPRVWVTRADQSVVLFNDVQVFRGKLVGFVQGKYQELPPAELQQLQVRKLAVARTVSLLAGTAIGFIAVAVVVSGGEDTFDPCAGDEDCSDAP